MYIDDSAAPPPSFLNNFGDIGTTAATFLDLENEAGTPPSFLPGFEDLSTTPQQDLLLQEDFVHAKPGLSTGGRFLEFAVNPEQMIPDWVKSDVLKRENLPNDTINPLHNLEMANPQCNPFPFCDENGCEQWQLMTLIVFQLLLLMLIVISNVTIISVIFDMNKSSRNRSYRSANIFKLSLALADLLLGLSILPPSLKNTINLLINEDFHEKMAQEQINSFGSPIAIIFGAGAVIATIASIWSIFAVQLDLFLRMRWPVKQHVGGILNTNRARWLTGLIWVFAIGVTFSLLGFGINFGLSRSTLSYGPIADEYSEENDQSTKFIIFTVLVWGLPFLLTLPLGVYLVVLIRNASKKLALRANQSYVRRHPDVQDKKKSLKKSWEATLRTITVEVIFFITFVPSIVARILYAYTDGCDPIINTLSFIATCILCIGSFANLFVYHLMWKDFQERLTALVCMVKKTDASPISSIKSPKTTRTEASLSVKINMSYDIKRELPI
ncbi:Oidioi.mRNA.OKI2018_I69.chr1.g992.t1.cds [Oikopleura dioica]|uniref:Oidioi.mRNA.OKI2018_I69.chr1.g992.t1.cds n=1 Tax=Oikopleura dioica TaxID=34765 RepID=A0ABN7SLK6_OIKDI|nr:Oidioi.mRNA.OKI2018_I69.chr1.g992.t1.cds [Oikopleura dioica]